MSSSPCKRLPGCLFAPLWRRGLLAAWLTALTLLTTLAEGPDDRFIDVYNLIQRADQSPDRRAAKKMYEDAQIGLKNLRRDYPSWNERVVSYRLRYTAEKLSAIEQLPVEPPVPPGGPKTADNPPASNVVVNQFNDLTQQIRLLQSDKQLLEAKLREALTAQPAPVDPREFQAAIERIATLQQTNRILITNLQRQEAERANLVSKVVVEEAQRAAADAQKELSAQLEKAARMDRERSTAAAELKRLQEETVKPLKLENSTLRQQVSGLKDETERGRQVEELSAKLAVLSTGLEELHQRNQSLAEDKLMLEKQVEDLQAKSAEEGILKIAQLESQLVVARADSTRQNARVEDLTAQLQRERQTSSGLESTNRDLARRVAELTASSADDAQTRRQLQESLAAEKADRIQAEAELKAAEQKLASLLATGTGTRPTAGTDPDPAAVLRTTELENWRLEVEKLREAVRSSARRETELTTALSQESALRQRLEQEKIELEKRLAGAQVQLAANRVEQSRLGATPSETTDGSRRATTELETRVRQLEEERETLRSRLGQLSLRPAPGLAATKARQTASTRERATDFMLERHARAFAPETPPNRAAFLPSPMSASQKNR